MKTKPSARVFDVRLSHSTTRQSKLGDGTVKDYPYVQNLHLVVVADTAGRANELALEHYPAGSVWQINHHGQYSDSRVIVDECQIEQ